MKRLRAWKSLVHDAVDGTVGLVGEGHASAARTTRAWLGLVPELRDAADVADAVRSVATAGVLASIRGVNRLVEAVTDAGLDVAEAAIGAPAASAAPERAIPLRDDAIDAALVADAAEGLVNGVFGDWLAARGNALDLGMRLRIGAAYADGDEGALARAAGAGPRVVVFVHGLATTEWSWCLNARAYHGDPAASFGTLLARDLGVFPVWVRYNTGRHVSENGRALADALERMGAAWPTPVEELALVGHSMGGLVARSACHQAAERGDAWVARVRRVVCLGSPHQGAPLADLAGRAASVLAAIDTPATRVTAELLGARSAGIRDLGRGDLLDEHWLARDPDAEASRASVPFLPGVSYWFAAATVTRDPDHPLGRVVGDLLVRRASASGPAEPAGSFDIETSCFGGVMHHELQNHPDVYRALRRILESLA